MDGDAKRLANLRRRVNRARNFPTNTCAASRHVHIIAENLIRYGVDHITNEEPRHAAESMLVVLEQLWKLRTKVMHSNPPYNRRGLGL